MPSSRTKRPISSVEDQSEKDVVNPRQRRRRTYYTVAQLERLEDAFQQEMFPGFGPRDKLSKELGINEDRIQVWFQNRRSKLRRQEKRDNAKPLSHREPSPASHTASGFLPASLYPGVLPFPPFLMPSCRVATHDYTGIPSTVGANFESSPLDFQVSESVTECRPKSVGDSHSSDEYTAAAGLLSVYTTANPYRHD